MFQWFLEQLIAVMRDELRGMERRIMATLKDVKDAEDRIGTSIARATSQNAANIKALADAIANQADPAEVQALLDEATAHADALDAAFPDTSGAGAQAQS